MKLKLNPHKKGSPEYEAYQEALADTMVNVLHVIQAGSRALIRSCKRKGK